ncbi:MAG: helix-turn-helix transcriptional regulator [Pseudomonadota bacterium]
MADQVDIVVGQRIRRRRRLMGMTQQDLGATCGVSFQQVQKYECAQTRVTVGMLWRLASALDVDVGYFFNGLPQPSAADLDASEEPSVARLSLARSSAA